MREHLLSPSLAAAPPSTSLYSARSSFLLSFFGGPMALVFYSALNSIRLKRPFDAIAYLLATALFVSMVYAGQTGAAGGFVTAISRLIGSEGSMRGFSRLYALLLWCGFYLMHRKQHRSANLFGESPSPWIAAIACFAAGFGATWLIALLIRTAYP